MMTKSPIFKKSILLFFIIVISLILCSCNDGYSSVLSIKYKSKSHLATRKFSLGIVKYESIDGTRYKIKDDYLIDFEAQLLSSKHFFTKDTIIDYRTKKHIFNGEESYIFTNADSYFAVGQDNEDYFYMKELLGVADYIDLLNNITYTHEFAVPPYLNNVRYLIQTADSEDFRILMGQTVSVPYDWAYLKSFYSRLSYTKINDTSKTITINCRVLITDMINKRGTEDLDKIDLVYSFDEELGDQIKFIVNLKN